MAALHIFITPVPRQSKKFSTFAAYRCDEGSADPRRQKGMQCDSATVPAAVSSGPLGHRMVLHSLATDAPGVGKA